MSPPNATAIATAAAPASPAAAARVSKAKAKSLYPRKAVTLAWMTVAALRSSVVSALGAMAMHPVIEGVATALALSDFAAFCLLALTLHTTLIAAGSAFFFACDRFGWFQRYKLERHPDAKNADGASLLKKSLTFVFFYHAVWRVALVTLLWQLMPYPPVGTPLPSFAKLVQHFFVVYWVGEYYNYASHKWLHESRQRWVRAAHEPHHKWRATESLAAEFSGALEIIVYTTLSYLHTAHLPMAVHFAAIVRGCAENVEVHSGYSFVGTPLSRLGLLYSYRVEIHDFHHQHPRAHGPFGKPLAGFDYLFGTCDEWLLHLNKTGRKAMYW